MGGTRGYVFADVLGFHAVAMTLDGELEPRQRSRHCPPADGRTGPPELDPDPRAPECLRANCCVTISTATKVPMANNQLLNDIRHGAPGGNVTWTTAGAVLRANRAGVDEDEQDAPQISGTKGCASRLTCFIHRPRRAPTNQGSVAPIPLPRQVPFGQRRPPAAAVRQGASRDRGPVDDQAATSGRRKFAALTWARRPNHTLMTVPSG